LLLTPSDIFCRLESFSPKKKQRALVFIEMSSNNATALRQALRQLDTSALAIQRAAAAMMVHYDKTPAVAVTEWRNCLLSRETRRDQLLPLLYVANEILQNSKRNRGNNFLKAFAPEGGGSGGGTSALGPALRHICAADRSLTEKVRRVVKIWGDRSVFSRRFVNELLTGLEPYRHAVEPPVAPTAGASLPAAPTVFRDQDDATFSPTQPDLSQESNNSNNTAGTDQDGETNDAVQEGERDDEDDDNDDDLMEILDRKDGKDHDDEDDEDDDDEDPFASSQGAKLELSIDLNSAAAAAASNAAAAAATASSSKKRRSSTGSHSTTASGGSGSNKKKSRRGSSSASGAGGGGSSSKNDISTNDLMDLWNRVSSLQQRYDLATLGMDRIQGAIRKKPDAELENLVGDELQEAWQETLRQEEQYLEYRQQFREIAVERKQLQQKATSYLSWLKQSLQQDTEDIAFCDMLHDKISTFKKVHARIVWAYELRQKEEEQRQAKLQEQERLRHEREEHERFRNAALQKQTEGGAGLVWNPTTREYQPLNTNEDWRD
jgi:CID domain